VKCAAAAARAWRAASAAEAANRAGGDRPTAADRRDADGGQADLCKAGVGGHGPHRRGADAADVPHDRGAQGGELSAVSDTPPAATIAAAGAW